MGSCPYVLLNQENATRMIKQQSFTDEIKTRNLLLLIKANL